MSKRVVVSKRDREKVKQQKREEKQKRKEERQSNGVSSFEDMIAYVDENGVLHSTPQERSTVDIEASEIAISIPKKEEVEELPPTGVVEFFNASKGFGFVKDRNSGEKYFFHISSAPENISEGNQVTFEIERGPRGMNAVRLSIISK